MLVAPFTWFAPFTVGSAGSGGGDIVAIVEESAVEMGFFPSSAGIVGLPVPSLATRRTSSWGHATLPLLFPSRRVGAMMAERVRPR